MDISLNCETLSVFCPAALMLMHGAAEHDYFYPKTLNLNMTWEMARNHCQVRHDKKKVKT